MGGLKLHFSHQSFDKKVATKLTNYLKNKSMVEITTTEGRDYDVLVALVSSNHMDAGKETRDDLLWAENQDKPIVVLLLLPPDSDDEEEIEDLLTGYHHFDELRLPDKGDDYKLERIAEHILTTFQNWFEEVYTAALAVQGQGGFVDITPKPDETPSQASMGLGGGMPDADMPPIGVIPKQPQALNLPINFIAIGAVVVIVLIIAVFFLTRNTTPPDATTEPVVPTEQVVATSTPVPDITPTQPAAPTEMVAVSSNDLTLQSLNLMSGNLAFSSTEILFRIDVDQAQSVETLADDLPPHTTAIYLPSRNAVIVATNVFSGGVDQLFLYQLSSGESRALSITAQGNSSAPAWSGNELVAYVQATSGEYRLIIHNLDTGVEESLFTSPNAISDIAWSPDERFIAFSIEENSSKNLHMLDTWTGDRQQLTGDNTVDDTNVVFAPDGNTIAFIRHHGDQQLAYTLVLTDTNAVPVQFFSLEAIDVTWSPDGHYLGLLTPLENDIPQILIVDIFTGSQKSITTNDVAKHNLLWYP